MKTNFDKFIVEQLKDPQIKKKFEDALTRLKYIKALKYIAKWVQDEIDSIDGLEYDTSEIDDNLKILKEIIKGIK